MSASATDEESGVTQEHAVAEGPVEEPNAPEPEPLPPPPAPEPTPTVSSFEATSSHPAGSAQPDGGVSVAERPEARVGAAFAGGFLVALVLKRILD